MARGSALALVAGVALAASGARAEGFVQRLSERGPASLVVGTAFTLSSPFAIWWGAVNGDPVAQPACRLGHGVKMVAAGAVLLPLGLLASPFNFRRLPDGWMDGVVEAYQEDYCSRPVASLYP